MSRKLLKQIGIVLFSLVIAAMPFLSSCAAEEAPPAPPAPPAPAPSEQPLKVGINMLMTGVAAEKGAPGGHGKLDCWKYINKELGGINGHPVEVHWYDNAYDAAKSISIAKKLMGEGCLLFTTSSSKMMEACMAITNRNGFPGMAYCSSTKCVHPPQYVYAQMPGYDDDWVAFAKYYMDNIWKGTGKPKMALHMLNNPVGFAAKVAALAFAEQLGIEVVAEEEHIASTISEMESMTRIRGLNVDVLWVSSTPAPASVIIKNAYELGMYPGITIGVSHAGMTKTLVDLSDPRIIEGVYGVSPVAFWGEDLPGMAKLTEWCKAMHPMDYGNTDYMGCWAESLIIAEVLRLALENCGYDKLARGDAETWKCVEMNGFRKLKNFSPGGLIGPVDFSDDYDRRGSKSLRIIKITSGELAAISDWIEAPPIHYEEFEWFKP